ncbi:MAG: diguanylate cyclase [Archangium sp.]|nr:diguanylate cyclase [Archangium sp.]
MSSVRQIAGPPRSPRAASSGAASLPGETEHYRALVEVTSDWLWEVDADGRYSYVSPKVKDLLGYEADEVLGRTPFDFMLPLEAQRLGARFAALVAARSAFHGLLNVNMHKAGHPVVLETSAVPLFRSDGEFSGFRGIDRDVTAREHALNRLRLADAAVQASAEGIVVADAHGNITACNPAFAAMSGYTEAALLGKAPSMLSSAEDARERLWDLIGGALKWSGEGQCRHRSAESFAVWMTLSAVRYGSQVTGYVALISDMTERRLAEATIRFQASHDALTQLVNRVTWLAAFKRALAAASSDKGRVAVLFVDLDGFKLANDTHGHGVGDVLLATTARRLERCVRRTDLVARFGGDEFTILLTDLTAKHVPERVAKACVAALDVPFRIDGLDVRVSASIGVAVFPDHGRTVDDLVAVADHAMYAAKRAGGARVQIAGAKPGANGRVKASAAAGRRSRKAGAAPGRTASPR